jgi:hypothetical protein
LLLLLNKLLLVLSLNLECFRQQQGTAITTGNFDQSSTSYSEHGEK